MRSWWRVIVNACRRHSYWPITTWTFGCLHLPPTWKCGLGTTTLQLRSGQYLWLIPAAAASIAHLWVAFWRTCTEKWNSGIPTTSGALSPQPSTGKTEVAKKASYAATDVALRSLCRGRTVWDTGESGRFSQALASICKTESDGCRPASIGEHK